MPDDEWSQPRTYRARPHLRRSSARTLGGGQRGGQAGGGEIDRGVPLEEISEDDLIDPNEGYDGRSSGPSHDGRSSGPSHDGRSSGPSDDGWAAEPAIRAKQSPTVVPRRRSGGTASPRVRRRRRQLVVLAVVVLLLLYPVTLARTALSNLHRVDALSSASGTPGRNFLIVGSDTRSGTDLEQVEGNRTDTIMLLQVPRRGPVVMLSIPRDSYVEIPGAGENKINAAYTIGGAPLLVETVEQNLGIKVDGYVETGLAGFGDIVDAVGGVTICPTRHMQDPYTGLDIQPGCQEVDGATALKYARSRHEDPLGDLGRVQRQREVLAAIMSKAASPGVLVNPFSSYPLARAGGKALTVDNEFGVSDLGYLFWGLKQANGTDGLSLTVPVGGTRNTSHGNVVVWDKTQSETVFEALRKGSTGNIEPIAEQQKSQLEAGTG